MVNLQKSQYANNYYINFGYIIEGLSLEGLKMHVYNRITSSSVEERERIGRLLNLESDVSDDERKTSLKDVLHEKLITKMKVINSKEDLSNELKSRSQTNDIPLIVKKYLNLQIE